MSCCTVVGLQPTTYHTSCSAHQRQPSIQEYSGLTAAGHARRQILHVLYNNAGVGDMWWMLCLRAKNWHGEKLVRGRFFWQIRCRRHDAAKCSCLHHQCPPNCSAAPAWPVAACGSTPLGMWARIYTTMVYTIPPSAVGCGLVVVKMESQRGAEEPGGGKRGDRLVRFTLMSTSSVPKLPDCP